MIHPIRETVDAEITVMMLPQRAGDAENPAENKSSNGPLRVQSNAISKVFCNVKAYVTCRRYDGISLRA